ncbi:PREDICTED: UBA-like domain-containing protein 1 isoform X1 [Vollenhovia emeryi]|uniref:UBA-like domain-containing protein 1 isoform X1 n=1 Tax=Vollenhovia emeryi TaxID=411798 RepID=UPI0005F434A2|nr:PREDICTED: UBA-like domain-containing protein 1 isoform X1 [Vollenhovia emeryi]XP_011863415.1 PREDICTED: UBA-like domain-containing protein 1 isoform X1 [Vollenhovia emeryi]
MLKLRLRTLQLCLEISALKDAFAGRAQRIQVRAKVLLYISRNTALSIFFQEAAIPSCAQGAGTHFGQITPCNTPATPPNFPDALLAFSKMSAGEKTPSGMSPSQNGFQAGATPMAGIVQHHAAGGRCSASGNTTQQQTQSQQTQFGLGEPQR